MSSSVSSCIITIVFLLSSALPELWAQEPAGSKPADIILHHGKVLTVDQDFSIAEAVAITGEQISAVGRNEDVLKLAGPNTLLIDLKGRTATPGFVDTHRHIDREAEAAYGGAVAAGQNFDLKNAIALQRFPIDWRAVRSKDDVLNQIKGWMDRVRFQKGEWVYFVSEGISVTNSDEQARILYDDLNRWEFDKVTPDNPMIFNMGIPENNGLIVNSKAIEWMFGEHGDFLRKYGHFWINAAGQPEGHLESPATRFPQNYMYTRPAEVLAPIFYKNEQELVSMGITTTGSNMPHDSVAAYRLLESRGEQLLRIGYGDGDPFGNVTDIEAGVPSLKNGVGSGSPLVWMNSITPGSMDGAGTRNCVSVQRKNAFSKLDAYWPTGQCYMDGEYRGAAGKGARISGNYYKDWVLAMGKYGVRFGNTHVAGDRTISLMLNTVEEIHKLYGPKATEGWSFDHCTQVNPAEFKRIARLGIMMSCASKYLESGQNYVHTYSQEVADTWLTPMKSMIKAGIKVVFESDRDVYFWSDMQKMSTRKDNKGNVWGPQEKLDRVEAMRVSTQWAAEYMLRKDVLGTIENGKWADIIVLDKDYMTVPVDEIETIHPQLTMVGGRIAFLSPGFSAENNLRPKGATISTYEELKKRRLNQTVTAGG